MSNGEKGSDSTPDGPLPRYSMRSDALSWLQDLYKEGALLSQFSGLIKFRLIVDANVILKDIRWLVRNRRSDTARTNLLELLEARAVDVFAPTYLSQEVSTHIATIAAEQGLDEVAMRAHWRRFEALIEFVDVGEPPEDDGSYVDNKDVPYIELQRRLGVPIVSEDPHIRQMGGVATPASITVTLRTYARASATRLSLEVAGVTSISFGLRALGAVARRFHTYTAPTISKVPKAAWAVLAGLCCVAVLHPTSRKWLSTNLTSILDRTASGATALLPILASLQADHAAAQTIGTNALAELERMLRQYDTDDGAV
ncbi:hypothetical protein R77569_00467 [Ralstonia mannitolilytica]|uniref:PIN domain-containing protein n=1 Tax=Ralstonia mannitolilytica TaxID=105219 RepID=A0ABN9JV96_9RALS|nr:hypothetical protein [Ralstonia mannitolilytica]CAJ0851295.1 hypothetical protein R77569_00467 [Ralstonia mannitolilytica]